MNEGTTASYTAAQRRQLEHAVARHGKGHAGPHCPACDAVLTVTNVERDPRVSYVRRRVWVVCPSCHRSAAVDNAGRSGATGPS